jgi:protein-L-isoaspartate(D-aspartate) O-methyltransferase
MGLFFKSEHESEEGFGIARRRMVERQIANRDVIDPHVLEVMARVPRHLFVDSALRPEAYDDNPLPIGCGQTISQPYIVASMTEHLHPSKSKEVLEIGTGSGYQTAVLAELFAHVDTVEYYAELSGAAQTTLNRLGYSNITFHVGDGLLIPDGSRRFDAIIVTAAPEKFPDFLAERLKSPGRMVIPIGGELQDLLLVVKEPNGQLSVKSLYPVRFVPLLSRNL